MLQNILSDKKWFDLMTPEDIPALTPLIYTHVNPYGTSFRYLPPYGVFDIKGPSLIEVKELNYCLGFFNSCVANGEDTLEESLDFIF